ncbi:hypothetical protein RY831_15000 [Noviherbaspirillum sp. CPCC 100848]|uniref:Uncharacterized protein n=1 Tax=Noviherbaspirillum album TaxID=3080276 RepID=A0ABU6JAK2_9BURK|nr:hypothetical protein [Noviherbaspirillum sp. CPCC 100848]MEC4720468.1 hypothetical protein [Noviherbaspirillum sp. CPCC 100848]
MTTTKSGDPAESINEAPEAIGEEAQQTTAAVRAWLETSAQDGIWESIMALELDSDGQDEPLDALDSDLDMSSLPKGDEAAALAALQSVEKLGRRRSSKKEEYVRNLTAEDFEDGSERLAFMIIKANVDELFNPKVKPTQFIEAAKWIFGRNTDAFNFEEACRTLSVRADVVRLRIQFQFWRLWKVCPVEFPFMVARVPEILEGEIYIVADEEGYDLARTAWLQPGIKTQALIEEASGGRAQFAKSDCPVFGKYHKALEVLSSRYIMSQQGDYWWLTGRNPIMRDLDLSNPAYRRNMTHLSWSKMF